MRRLSSDWIAALVATAIAIVVMLVVLLGSDGGGGTPRTEPTSAAPTSTGGGVARDTPMTPSSGGRAVPVRVPGYAVAPVAIGTARESLVFRTRNSILNGLSGASTDYLLEIKQATRAGRTSLLIGVAARDDATPSAIPADIARLIGAAPDTRRTVAGHPIAVYPPAGGNTLAIVDGGARRAVVVMATGPREALALGTAVARGI